MNLDWDHERHAWEVPWVSHPTSSVFDYGVFHFRKAFELGEIPESFIIHLSADNRYKLWVNGKQITTGPARGSFLFWRYETIDITAELKTGNNIIAAEVFNLGKYRPAAQYSRQTAFILKADAPFTDLVSTSTPWKVSSNKAYSPLKVTKSMVHGFYVAGPTDRIDGKLYPWGWQEIDYDDSEWETAEYVAPGVGRGYMHGVPWMLVQRQIPFMEQTRQRISGIVRSSGDIEVKGKFLQGSTSLNIPANSKLTILLDNKVETIGYPEINVSGGKGSEIKITYAESLYDSSGRKGNRNITENKTIEGYQDIILPGGGINRTYLPLWLRTWRYIELEITTLDTPLEINDFSYLFTAYPFELKAEIETDLELMDEIWDVGWRTARLCAGETYMDCPYYEQLQYIGDTRIQSLISLYLTGDDRLMKNALRHADESRIPSGLTLGRGPSFIPQVTPPFSLYWIDMIHDYYMHRPDEEFLQQFIPGIRSVLGWFESRIDERMLMGPSDWFNISDWTDGYNVGSPPGSDEGGSALLSLNYVYALDRAAELFTYFEYPKEAQAYKQMAAAIRKAVFKHCYDPGRGLIAETPHKEQFSQHTNIFAILTNTIIEEDQPAVMHKILTEEALIQTTVYFKFYLAEALYHVGMSEEYIDLLSIWEEMLDAGHTTFPEGDYEDRSDCHAWSASPLYHFMSIICGIRPSSPAFRTVSISPAPGSLKVLRASMPHPQGEIRIDLKIKREKISGEIILPKNITGTFNWKGNTYKLSGGCQTISAE